MIKGKRKTKNEHNKTKQKKWKNSKGNPHAQNTSPCTSRPYQTVMIRKAGKGGVAPR
jgi:hypothetical protein